MYRQKRQPATAQITKGLQTLNVSKQKPNTPQSNRRYHDINLVANYFAIQLANAKSKELFQYTINVDPSSTRRRLRRRAIYCWLQTHNLGVNYATNYHNFLVTSVRMPDHEDLEDFEYWDEHETGPRQTYAPSCRITIKFHTQIDIPLFLAQLNPAPRVTDPDQKADMLIIMNMIFSQRMNERSFRVPTQQLRVAAAGADKFFQLPAPNNEDLLGGGRDHSRALLVAHRGFVRNIRSSTRLLLNVNNATGVFYRPGLLSKLIDDFIGQSQQWPRFDLSAFLRGLRVSTKHLMSSNGRPEKIYTVSCVARPATPNHNQRPTPARIFFNLSGVKTSGGTFYAQNHGHTRVNNASNCIVVQCGPDDHPIYLPSTVFDVLPGQPFKKPLSQDQLADFITHSCRDPIRNRDDITGRGFDFFGIRPPAHDGPNARFGISIEQKMVKVEGRILFPPVVSYRGDEHVDEVRLARGGWNLMSKHFAVPAPPSKWTFLQICFQNDRQIVHHENLKYNADNFGNAMPTYGIDGHCMFTGDATFHTLTLEGSIDSWDPAMDVRNERAIRQKLQNCKGKEVQLVLITLPAKMTKLYAMIKWSADVHVGIHTICAVTGWQKWREESFWGIKDSPQFLGNLLLKYNLKLGGINHRLLHAQGGILARKTMFVGMDVTHPSQGSQSGAPSIVAVVATEEPTYFVNWPVSLRLQRPSKDKQSRELIDDLQVMFAERLEHWKQMNKGTLPDQIIIYRDGVADDFFHLVQTHEIPRIKQAIAGAAPGYEPAIVYLVVLKRHSTRFFPSPEVKATDQRLFDANKNPKPGLLIRDTLTRKEGFGFFLQSHESLKGTARPAHYLLKHNTTNHAPFAVATLTHDFCYLFSRATRSVHIHPAIFYADLACTRARHYLRRVYYPTEPGQEFDENQWLPNNLYKPHANLQGSMFYV